MSRPARPSSHALSVASPTTPRPDDIAIDSTYSSSANVTHADSATHPSRTCSRPWTPSTTSLSSSVITQPRYHSTTSPAEPNANARPSLNPYIHALALPRSPLLPLVLSPKIYDFMHAMLVLYIIRYSLHTLLTYALERLRRRKPYSCSRGSLQNPVYSLLYIEGRVGTTRCTPL